MYNFEKERKTVRNKSVFLDVAYKIIMRVSPMMVIRPVPTT